MRQIDREVLCVVGDCDVAASGQMHFCRDRAQFELKQPSSANVNFAIRHCWCALEPSTAEPRRTELRASAAGRVVRHPRGSFTASRCAVDGQQLPGSAKELTHHVEQGRGSIVCNRYETRNSKIFDRECSLADSAPRRVKDLHTISRTVPSASHLAVT